ncbi:MmcQ/YjbR family DNA-binding protein [Streptococcus dentasini]
MAFEDEFFRRKTPDEHKLIAYGFYQTQTGYSYAADIMEGDFEAQINIARNGRVSGCLIDKDLGEEYTAIHVTAGVGHYVGQVREVYGALLEDIAQACFDEHPFDFPQSNRLAHHLAIKFGDQFDYPFAKYPQYAAFRHPANQKWYALLFPLAFGKLIKDDNRLAERDLERQVEVINIKIAKERLSDLLQINGIYSSYHMNKQSWISIVLDDSLSDNLIFELVEQSRSLVGPKGYKSISGPDYWLIPANPKYYDIDAEFAASDRIKWTQKAQIQKGDWVFIYMTAPIKAVRYACRVLETYIPNESYRDRSDIKALMEIERVKTFEDWELPMDLLKEQGVKTVRGPRRMTKELIDFVVNQLKD